MRRTALSALLLLAACSSDGDVTGPAGTGSQPLAPHAPAANLSVQVDTLPRTVGVDLGRGVSDAGGIPVTLMNESGFTLGAVWSASGFSRLGTVVTAHAITASGDLLGLGLHGTEVWSGQTTFRIVGAGATALNDLGTVMIRSTSPVVRWDGDVMKALKHPGSGGGLFPLAVNNSGKIVGVWNLNAFEAKAVLWNGATPKLLGTLAPTGAHGALGINNAGRMVGYSTGTVNGVSGRYPVLWQSATTPRPQSTLPGVAPFGNAQDINEAGDIVGFLRTASGADHAMLWRANGERVDLGASLPDFSTYARGISNGGVISGVAYPPGANPDFDTPILVRWTVTEEAGFTFGGFFAPVANSPELNVVKAGKIVPVRFSLGGDHGLDVVEDSWPRTPALACDANATQHQVTELVTGLAGALTFDPVTEQYTYLFKAKPAWSGTCRELKIRFTDGQTRSLRFRIVP